MHFAGDAAFIVFQKQNTDLGVIESLQEQASLQHVQEVVRAPSDHKQKLNEWLENVKLLANIEDQTLVINKFLSLSKWVYVLRNRFCIV